MNRYRVVDRTVHLPGETHEQGDEFDYEFSEEDETTNVGSGRLEIVARTYRVVGGSEVDGHAPGETFEAALSVGREALLVAGGHIERVDDGEAIESVSGPVEPPVEAEPPQDPEPPEHQE